MLMYGQSLLARRIGQLVTTVRCGCDGIICSIWDHRRN